MGKGKRRPVPFRICVEPGLDVLQGLWLPVLNTLRGRRVHCRRSASLCLFRLVGRAL